MKIALAQINPTVGDLSGNRDRIVEFAARARAEQADLVVFPELCVSGYPPLDLLDNPSFVTLVGETIKQIAASVPSDLGVLVGAPVPNPDRTGHKLLNAALLLYEGEVVATVGKRLLPTYDVFDESRYFEPVRSQPVVEFKDVRLGVHICEDMWNIEDFAEYHTYEADPLADLCAQGIDLFINISASPFSVGKHNLRDRIMKDICDQYKTPFVLVNQVGANTEILYDGDSRVHAADGTLLVCAPSFEESLLFWNSDASPEAELDEGQPKVRQPKGGTHYDHAPEYGEMAEMHDALVMGIRDYFTKTGVFTKALIGLSGGIDSAVTCALAVEALGPGRVVGLTMPSAYSSPGSVSDSEALARNLGIECHEISIRPAVNAFSEMLEEFFSGTSPGPAEENVQARTRGVVLMAISNKFGYLLLTTGNKSELSMGYATLYGDMSGGLAVLSDVFKTRVYTLARFINARRGSEVIPENSITKPPSAELAPDQKDEDSLPPYPVLDEILRRYIERRQDLDAIVAESGYDTELVHSILTTVDRNEYKRKQAPPGLRVSGKAFGIGRRIPIVQRFERLASTISRGI